MDNCIFCKIIKGEIPCAKVYEDKEVLAFLDIGPVNKGHTLIIPKEHYEVYEHIPDDQIKKLAVVTKKISKAVIKGVKADGYNLGMNNYEAAGQVVKHAHIHIMPRFNGDGLKLWPQGRYNDGEMEKVRKQIVENMK